MQDYKNYLAAIALFSSISLQAATDTGLSTQEGNPQSLYEHISQRTVLNYSGVYRGAALNDPGNAFTPDSTGALDPDNPQSLENLVTAGYRLSKHTYIGVTTHFNLFPSIQPNRAGAVQMLDPGLVYDLHHLVDQHGFKLSSQITLQIPMSNADHLQPKHLLTAITPSISTSYDIPGTSLTLGAYAYIRGYISDGMSPSGTRTYKLYIAPNASYQLSRTVAATLWVDLVQGTRPTGTGFFAGMTNEPIDIEPGISWDVTKNITLNPIINFYPNHPTLAATSFQANISAKAF